MITHSRNQRVRSIGSELSATPRSARPSSARHAQGADTEVSYIRAQDFWNSHPVSMLQKTTNLTMMNQHGDDHPVSVGDIVFFHDHNGFHFAQL